MDIEQAKIALVNARCDLSLAISYPNLKIYKQRCQWSIEHITKVLGDSEEFAKTLERWERENKER